MLIPLLCILSIAIAEPPVGDGYPSAHSNHDHDHHQAHEHRHGSDFQRSPSQEYGVPSIRGFRNQGYSNARSDLSEKYRTPGVQPAQSFRSTSESEPSKEYGSPLSRHSSTTQHGAPASRNGISQENNVADARSFTRQYLPSTKTASSDYLPRNDDSLEYMPASSPSAQYGAPGFNSGYPATSTRNSPSSSYGASGFSRAQFQSSLSRQYGVPKSNDLSKGYGAPRSAAKEAISNFIRSSTHKSSSHSNNAPLSATSSTHYRAPSSKALDSYELGYNSPSGTYGAPNQSTLSNTYGTPEQRSLPDTYGVPNQRTLSESHSSYNQGTLTKTYGAPEQRTLSDTYGVPEQRTLSENYDVSQQRDLSETYGVPEQRSLSDTYGVPEQRTLSDSYGVPEQRNSHDSNTVMDEKTLSQEYGAPESLSKVANLKTNAIALSYASTRSSPSQEYGAPSGRDTMSSEQYRLQDHQGNLGDQGYSYERNAVDELRNQEPANYDFAYKVIDDQSGSDYGHTETRQDNKAEGAYFVVLPDGTKQVVEYEADERGFKPRISVEPANGAAGYDENASDLTRTGGPY